MFLPTLNGASSKTGPIDMYSAPKQTQSCYQTLIQILLIPDWVSGSMWKHVLPARIEPVRRKLPVTHCFPFLCLFKASDQMSLRSENRPHLSILLSGVGSMNMCNINSAMANYFGNSSANCLPSLFWKSCHSPGRCPKPPLCFPLDLPLSPGKLTAGPPWPAPTGPSGSTQLLHYITPRGHITVTHFSTIP